MSRTAAPRNAQRSRVRIASLGREKPGRAPLDEQDHENEDRHLAEHGAEARLDDLVEPADADGGQDRAEEFAYAAGHDDHERVHDVVLPELGPDIADLRERASGQAGESRAEGERESVHAAGPDAETGRHAAALGHRADSQPG